METNEASRYQCQRCGGDTTDRAAVLRRFCVFCGVSAQELELEHVTQPASASQSGVHRLHKLPAAV